MLTKPNKIVQRQIVAHGHIFKNAGSTIDWILNRNFSKNFHDDREDFKMRAEPDYLSQLLSEKPNITSFSSHSLPLPVLKQDGFEFFVIVMMRHPILRVRSVYDFERKQPGTTPGAINAKKLSFPRYVEWRMQENIAPTIRNMHVRYLTANSLPHTEVMGIQYYEKALQLAKENSLVGIVENFDESMVVFSNYLKANGINIDFSYKKQNVSKKPRSNQDVELKSLRGDLGEGLYGLLLENNELDLRLYDSVSKLVMERFNSLPKGDELLTRFRISCTDLD